MIAETDFLFIYGTLKTDANLSGSQLLDEESILIGQGFLEGKLFEVNGYPGAIHIPDGEFKVLGDIRKLNNPERVFKSLDHYEEIGDSFPHPNEYSRVVLPVRNVAGQILHCWVYHYNWPVDQLFQIVSGDYQQFTRTKK